MLERFKLFKKRKPKDFRFLGMKWENEEAWTKLVYGFGHDGTKNIYETELENEGKELSKIFKKVNK
ncbi:MAG: hypothetical protein QW783_03030 [Candidatus Micrarchaeia archaeon]